MTRRYLGIDVGGTSCKLAVLEVDGDRAGPPPKLLATAVLPTGPGGPGEVLDRLAAEGARLAAEHGPVAAAGAGVPGLFDEASGRTLFLPNLPAAWNGREFGRPLAGRLGVPTVLINDARAFTLAESRMGAAAGCSTVVCLTLGTGVGGGVVVDGRLRYGPHGRAGEVGHQVIDPNGPRCGCGNRGCVEAFAAGAALSRLGGQDSPQAVFRAAAAGDELAAAAVQAVAWRLAVGIANLVTVLWPERVVVGGGVAAAGERLLGPLRAAVADATPLVDPASYEIVPAALGPAAGAIGAALWAEERGGRADAPAKAEPAAGASRVGVDHVDDVAVGDIPGLGALEHPATLVEEDPQLDQERRLGRQVEQLGLARPGQPGRDRPRGPGGHHPPPLELAVQRAFAEVLVQHAAQLGDQRRLLQRHRDAVGQPDPDHADDLAVGGEPEVEGLAAVRVVHAGAQQPAGRLHPPPVHLLGERQEHPRPPVDRAVGHEGALAPPALHQPVVGQLLKGLAHGHPADREPLAQLGLTGQGIARTGPLDQGAKVLLDLPVAGLPGPASLR